MMKQVHIYYIFSTSNSIKIFVLTIRILLLKSSNKIIQDVRDIKKKKIVVNVRL